MDNNIAITTTSVPYYKPFWQINLVYQNGFQYVVGPRRNKLDKLKVRNKISDKAPSRSGSGSRQRIIPLDAWLRIIDGASSLGQCRLEVPCLAPNVLVAIEFSGVQLEHHNGGASAEVHTYKTAQRPARC